MRFLIDDGSEKREFPLVGDKTLVFGRVKSCHLVIESGKVSRRHCQCVIQAGAVTIKDLGSKNGTFVNGVRITEKILEDGDEVSLGLGVTFRFDAERSTAPSPVAGKTSFIPATEKYREDSPTPMDKSFAPPANSVPAPQALVVAVPVASDPRHEASQPRNIQAGGLLRSPVAKAALILVPILAILGAILYQILNAPPPTIKPEEKYLSDLEKSVDLFKRREYKSAEETLTDALRLTSNNLAAKAFLDFVRVWEKAGADYGHLNWREAENFCNELMDAQPSTPAVRQFASDQQRWLQREAPNMAIIAAIQGFRNTDDWTQAVVEMDKLPANSDLRNAYRRLIEDVLTGHYRSLLASADQAFAKERWEDARGTYELAIARAPEVERAAIDRKSALCRQNLEDEKALREGENFLRNRNFQEAGKSLARITAGSPYHAKAGEFITQIENALNYEQAIRLYDDGKIEEALRFLSQKKPAGGDELRKQMEQVQETFRMANAAFEKDNLEEAVSLWTHLKTLEPSPSNYFNRQAKDKLTRWGDDSRRAQYYFDKAEKMYGEERYEDARANYLMANRTDKTGRPGDAGIRRMENRASDLFNKAINISSSEEKKKMLRDVIRLVPADNRFHELARKELDRNP
ncbi:MAG: FHA domain-containing protein [Planctomycetota bacterium]